MMMTRTKRKRTRSKRRSVRTPKKNPATMDSGRNAENVETYTPRLDLTLEIVIEMFATTFINEAACLGMADQHGSNKTPSTTSANYDPDLCPLPVLCRWRGCL